MSPQESAKPFGASSTKSSNTTSVGYAPNPTSGSCCFMTAHYVGVNTWYSKPIEVIVATVITTWLQYNNTIVPGNSTTKTMNATSYSGTYTYGGAVSSIPKSIPTDILPSWATRYGRTVVGQQAISFPDQDGLVVQSPTPFILYTEVDLDTSWACPTKTVMTSYTELYQGFKDDGSVFTVSTVYPAYTTDVFPSYGMPLMFPQRNAQIPKVLVQPFPNGDYSNFSYDAWMDSEGAQDGYKRGTPDLLSLTGLPSFLAGIPTISSLFPDVASCSNLGGNGQPTVHIPVTEVTISVHPTLTIPGAHSTSVPPATRTAASQQANSPSTPTIAATQEFSTPTPGGSTLDSPETPTLDLTGPSRPKTIESNKQGQHTTYQSPNQGHPGPMTTSSQSEANIGGIIASIIQATQELHFSDKQTQPPAPMVTDNPQQEPTSFGTSLSFSPPTTAQGSDTGKSYAAITNIAPSGHTAESVIPVGLSIPSSISGQDTAPSTSEVSDVGQTGSSATAFDLPSFVTGSPSQSSGVFRFVTTVTSSEYIKGTRTFTRATVVETVPILSGSQMSSQISSEYGSISTASGAVITNGASKRKSCHTGLLALLGMITYIVR